MVRPRKIPHDFVPVEWTDTESESENAIEDEDEVEDVFEDANEDVYVNGDEVANEDVYVNGDEVANEDVYVNGDEVANEDVDEDVVDLELDNPLEILAREWLIIEMSHNVSKRASDKFWKAAQRYISNQFTKEQSRNESFTHIRRQLRKKYCPEVSLDLAYKHIKTGEICMKTDVQKITSKFRKPEYEPLYEIASVQVRSNH